jgi:molybdenum cofactor synthesis domain-containing protein
MFKIAVLTISDRCSRGEMDDESGKVIMEMLKGKDCGISCYDIVADEADLIKERLTHYSDDLKVDFVFTTGGTGFGPRDVTPEATMAISQKPVPGISEFIRSQGFKKTKNAILSRAVSVIRKNTLIINLPGSPKGARESLEPILDIIPHAHSMIRGSGH